MAAIKHDFQGKSNKSSTTAQVPGVFTSEILKSVVESVGYDKPADEALQYLSENLTFVIKETIQEATKFRNKSKRKMLSPADIDHALKVRNIEPVYGFTNKHYVPFRHASGGGREIYFQEDVDIDLEDLMSQSLPKAPLEITLKSHWLAIDGIQPSIPENPPPIKKEMQLNEVVSPFSKSRHIKEVGVDKVGSLNKNSTKEGKKESKSDKRKAEELKKIADEKADSQKCKPLVTHELSVEQQMYYKELTEASVGSIETKRTEALQSLSNDPGLYQLLPRFITFISEGVRVNVAQHNLAILIYLLRMIKSLLENSTLYLEKYLHEVIPAVMTCIVSKQLCPRPDFDNHWALRDFAARLMAQICKHFNTPTNNIQPRITKSLSLSLDMEKAPLSTHYGALAGLSELGFEVIKSIVLPRIKSESGLIKEAINGNNSAEKKAAEHLQALLVKHCTPVIFKTLSHGVVETQEQFVDKFGFVGNLIFQKVNQMKLTSLNRQQISALN
ncbi:transcription initiation factor TFIID subunit 6-like [Clytia hemisphaerica]|uniref:Transcription initiation factor TFIID subunit 6 n=1 Tax=Clytia hemisphaerica TaxID=252671 RepID=A0A7M5XFC2_9CNID